MGTEDQGQAHWSVHIWEAGRAAGGPGRCGVTGARGLPGAGCCFKPIHPSETLRSVRTEEKPLDLAITRSQVTLHRAFADGTLSIKQCTHPPPSPLGSASSREVLPADETPHQLLSSLHPQTP